MYGFKLWFWLHRGTIYFGKMQANTAVAAATPQLPLRRRLNCYIVAATTVTDCNLELHFDRKEERVIYKDTLSSTQRGGQNREGLNKSQSGQYFIKTVHRT